MHDVDVGCGAFPLGTDPSGYVPRSELSTPVQRNQKGFSYGVTVSMTDETNQRLAIHFAGPSGMRKTNSTYPQKPSTAGRTYKSRQSAREPSTMVCTSGPAQPRSLTSDRRLYSLQWPKGNISCLRCRAQRVASRGRPVWPRIIRHPGLSSDPLRGTYGRP